VLFWYGGFVMFLLELAFCFALAAELYPILDFATLTLEMYLDVVKPVFLRLNAPRFCGNDRATKAAPEPALVALRDFPSLYFGINLVGLANRMLVL